MHQDRCACHANHSGTAAETQQPRPAGAYIRPPGKHQSTNKKLQNHLSYTCRIFYFFAVLCTHYTKEHLPKSSGREKAAKWTNMATKQVTSQQQSLQHRPDLDPTAPVTSNIPPREGSREPQHWVKCANMEKDMSQPKIGTNVPQIWPPTGACFHKQQKRQTCQNNHSYTCRTSFFTKQCEHTEGFSR